ncbi:MAG: glycoside hydrolase family 43 protein [Gammaproteobacteria bacterium]|nr:glycoside hydrolase family 43 protein [Gammaproteobacteria bacterium]NNC98453.1 glycoside hydrolase family 43 protein [Gammaproteobacteria bacterium]NNM14760.1 glycoside hydrolase family 43 protein [Gammaproteobacteria bacterium]
MRFCRRNIFSLLYVCSIFLSLSACSATPDKLLSSNTHFTNPIITGGYPDPSICQLDDYFYIVNSSFEYYPGLPIHRSKDLVNWELVAYGLQRESQVTGAVNLVDVQSNGGIHAPTIRCRKENGKNRFYIITTNVYTPTGKNAKTEFVNFVLTADDIQGPWSDPLVLEGAPGIDPDIFFDDDGRVWYAGTHSPENPTFPGEGEIWLQEIDTASWELTGERHFLWRGACGGTWAEGPHLYKHDGRYYLLIAEGGTGFNHAVMIAVSDDITGPYVPNERNPIMTSRHLSYDYWVNSTGHADMIQLGDGRWYMVALGKRNDEQRMSNMGRETHLLPVEWEREPFWWKEPKYDWPVVSKESGRLEKAYPLPFGSRQQPNINFRDEFDSSKLGLEWNFRRFPERRTYSLSESPGYLRLFSQSGSITERGRASLLGVRQKQSDFVYTVAMLFNPSTNNSEAGISLFQKDDNYINFTTKQQNNKIYLQLFVAQPEDPASSMKSDTSSDPVSRKVIQSAELPKYRGEIVFKVESKESRNTYRYSLDGGKTYQDFAQSSADIILSKGYTGAYLGLYSSSNGSSSEDFADFDWVEYTLFPRN